MTSGWMHDGESLSPVDAIEFAKRWAGTISEDEHSREFWGELFRKVLRVDDHLAAGINFEKKLKNRTKGTREKPDVFWKGYLLAEQKSAGVSLVNAEVQAREYLVSLPPTDRPPFLILCDFRRFIVIDLLMDKRVEFALEDLPHNLHHFELILSRDKSQSFIEQLKADEKAAKLMANLFIQLEKYGYTGHTASVFLMRILFSLFADDTRMWKQYSFLRLVEDTNENGSDLGPRLNNFFALLDTPTDKRLGPQDPLLADFPYVNGGLFSEKIEVVNFNGEMRAALLAACNYDWGSINPTIFGALFQNVKPKAERSEKGEFYTTEDNIRKVIDPLFMNELNKRAADSWNNPGALESLRNELGGLRIFDPACGCGNFLLVAYKALRQLELDILVRLSQLKGSLGEASLLDVKSELKVTVGQLYGIEVDEWSAEVARAAVYLTDHQQNIKLQEALGAATNHFPLRESANIVLGSALQLDWSEVAPLTPKTYIVGNPPFKGSLKLLPWQSAEQQVVWMGHKKSKLMDYVTNWYLLAARYSKQFGARVAFVSTNSITQGEQPAILWEVLGQLGVEIQFAHRTFAWDSDIAGKAGVHVVIIGFQASPPKHEKKLWFYDNYKGVPSAKVASNINCYLLDSEAGAIPTRQKPLSTELPYMNFGSMPRDEGHLSDISPDEAKQIEETDPIARQYLRRLVGADELIQGRERYCLWLTEANPTDLATSKVLKSKVSLVREFREKSKADSTRKASATAHLFVQRAQPKTTYIAVPRVSSESRRYIPMAFMPPSVIASDALLTIATEELYVFSLLQSRIFNVWAKTVSGGLESRIRISQEITYNNFPVPAMAADFKSSLNESGKLILEARQIHSGVSLRDLYSGASMMPDLLKAHNQNDALVSKLFGLNGQAEETEILERLFDLHDRRSRGEVL